MYSPWILYFTTLAFLSLCNTFFLSFFFWFDLSLALFNKVFLSFALSLLSSLTSHTFTYKQTHSYFIFSFLQQLLSFVQASKHTLTHTISTIKFNFRNCYLAFVYHTHFQCTFISSLLLQQNRHTHTHLLTQIIHTGTHQLTRPKTHKHRPWSNAAIFQVFWHARKLTDDRKMTSALVSQQWTMSSWHKHPIYAT